MTSCLNIRLFQTIEERKEEKPEDCESNLERPVAPVEACRGIALKVAVRRTIKQL